MANTTVMSTALGLMQDFSGSAANVPIGSFTLLATVPVWPGRRCIEIQNQSGLMLQLVRDDGAGNAVTSWLIDPAAAGAGKPGAAWASTTFRGRLRVYGPAGAQFALCQE